MARGRRRRQRLTCGAALLVVALLGGAIAARPLLQPAPTVPVTPVTPLPGPRLPTVPVRVEVTQRAQGRIAMDGTWRGQHWRYSARRKWSERDKAWTLSDWFEFDSGACGGGTTFEPVVLSFSYGGSGGPTLITGKVSQGTAVVRTSFQRGTTRYAPVDVQVIDGGPGMPDGFFLVDQPKGLLLREIVLLDRQSRKICSDQFRVRRVGGHLSSVPVYGVAGSCHEIIRRNEHARLQQVLGHPPGSRSPLEPNPSPSSGTP